MKPLHISIIWLTFAPFLNAAIAQLVEHDLAKVGVAGPSPVFRSFLFVIEKHAYYEFIFEIFRSRDICYKC